MEIEEIQLFLMDFFIGGIEAYELFGDPYELEEFKESFLNEEEDRERILKEATEYLIEKGI